ncbi:MAG TPA: hypothetical protein VND62_08970 [Acidimicrobiales bacterium]|nr:hypothetical protein [Acidimicrobiales bacterium]
MDPDEDELSDAEEAEEEEESDVLDGPGLAALPSELAGAVSVFSFVAVLVPEPVRLSVR